MSLRNKLLWTARLLIAISFATFIFLDEQIGIFISMWSIALMAGVYLTMRK